jgi:hypothetical protein
VRKTASRGRSLETSLRQVIDALAAQPDPLYGDRRTRAFSLGPAAIDDGFRHHDAAGILERCSGKLNGRYLQRWASSLQITAELRHVMRRFSL